MGTSSGVAASIEQSDEKAWALRALARALVGVKEMKPLTLEQVHTLLEAAKGRPLEALFVLAVMSGRRRSDLFGLRWQDIDFGKACCRAS